MKFVDEATIQITAGKGGNGCLSFLREKYRPKGGPDGGNGGDGGSVFLVPQSGLNTLADFRYVRAYKAKNGEGGAGRDRYGKNGDDLQIRVPEGTRVTDFDTGEFIGDVLRDKEPLLVARGGKGGLGNANFKSSTNRTPRKTTKGKLGDDRTIYLELMVLADVGLLGYPNAGKSTFLSTVSQARPKIADYPFTTLHPNLGVIYIGESNSFVIADIPGLIRGAADGAGLGIQFLRHLKRTRILLHMVDMAPMENVDLAQSVRDIETEMERFDPDLKNKERWLVLNKKDSLDSKSVDRTSNEIVRSLDWSEPVYAISSVTGDGCDQLLNDIMGRLIELQETRESADPSNSGDQP